MRLTLAEFKQTASWPAVLNMESSDVRWLKYLNEASQRLLNMAMWVGTTQRYAVCVNSACLTWPRQIESIIAMAMCNRPISVRSRWHEFLENGPGLARLRSCPTMDSYDRGSGFAMFDDITVASRIRLYPQFNSDVGKTVTIRGLDSNYQPVLTIGGDVEGEVMTIATPYVDSVTVWGKQIFHQVIKQKTKGYVRAYSYDASLPIPPASPGPNDTPLTALAVWEPTETLPDYRRSFIPALDRARCCGQSLVQQSDCDKAKVTIIGKTKFIPIESDLDFLPIGNAPALKLAMRSVMLEERSDWEGAKLAMYGSFDPIKRKYVNGAVPILDDELGSWQGDGMVTTVRLESGLTDRVNVVNLI